MDVVGTGDEIISGFLFLPGTFPIFSPQLKAYNVRFSATSGS
jgi:hypothetical protein